VWAPSPDPVVDPTGYIYGAADATGIFMPLVCTLNAAKVTDAVARLLGVDHDEMAALALGAPARGDRAVLLPYFDGERSPDRPRARGELAGLRTDVTRGELARAAFEGVVLGLHDGLLALERAGVDTSGRLIATGGAAQSPAYRQFLADVFERPVHHPPLADAGAGIAVQAAAVAQGRKVADVAAEWAAPMAVCAEPRPHQGLDELRAGYDALRERTAERQSELATVSR
jgi:xylulokinase